MHPFPHHYHVRNGLQTEGEVSLDSEGLPQLRSLPPPEWGGPGGYWAPETLLLAALGDCTMLTFRAIAKASRFEWREIAADGMSGSFCTEAKIVGRVSASGT